MQLSIVTLAPHYLGIAGTCLEIQFCTLWCPEYSPGYCPGLRGDMFPINPQVGPRPITPGAFGQSPRICRHPRVVDFQFFWPKYLPALARGRSWVSGDTLFCKSPCKSPLDPGYCLGSGGPGIQLINCIIGIASKASELFPLSCLIIQAKIWYSVIFVSFCAIFWSSWSQSTSAKE